MELDILNVGDICRPNAVRRLPVMPEVEPKNHMRALNRVFYINSSHQFKVIGREFNNKVPWYEIEVTDPGPVTTPRRGFINSISMIGNEPTRLKISTASECRSEGQVSEDSNVGNPVESS